MTYHIISQKPWAMTRALITEEEDGTETLEIQCFANQITTITLDADEVKELLAVLFRMAGVRDGLTVQQLQDLWRTHAAPVEADTAPLSKPELTAVFREIKAGVASVTDLALRLDEVAAQILGGTARVEQEMLRRSCTRVQEMMEDIEKQLSDDDWKGFSGF